MRRSKKIFKWTAAAAVLVLLVYALSQTAGFAYTEDDITVADFSSLNRSQRRAALRAVNQARCTCGCGMTLAQCVVTDSTCPLRTENIGRIRAAIEEQSVPPSGS